MGFKFHPELPPGPGNLLLLHSWDQTGLGVQAPGWVWGSLDTPAFPLWARFTVKDHVWGGTLIFQEMM